LQQWYIYNHAEGSHTERACAKALSHLHQLMADTQIENHLDTLSQWDGHWPDLTDRMTGVAVAAHDYVEALPQEYLKEERDTILHTMLSDWEQWCRQLHERADRQRIED